MTLFKPHLTEKYVVKKKSEEQSGQIYLTS